MKDKSQNKLVVSEVEGMFVGELFVESVRVKDAVSPQLLIVRQTADEYFGVNRYMVEYK